jgi:hypothetical protein
MVVPHAFLAQWLLATIVAIAYFTSAESLSGAQPKEAPGAQSFRRGFLALAALAFVQLLLGAGFRHANAEGALYAHAALALLLVSLTAMLATRAQGLSGAAPGLARGAAVQGGLLMFQVFLGFLAWFFRLPKNGGESRSAASLLFPTAHVVAGALILAGFVLLTLRARRLLAPCAAAPDPSRLRGARPVTAVQP